MAYLSELFSFLVLVPSAVLCLLPMRRQLKLSPKRLVILLCLLFALLIPSCAALVVAADIPTNYVLLPLMAVLFVCYHRVLKTHLFVNSAVFLLVMALMSFPCSWLSALRCFYCTPGSFSIFSAVCWISWIFPGYGASPCLCQ